MSTPENQKAGTSHAPISEADDRRRWPRVLDEKRSKVWFSTPTQGAQFGRLEDIALGGFAMKVSDVSELQIDRQILVGMGGWLIPARVKTILDNGPTGFRVGLEWIRPKSPAVVSILQGCCES